MLSLTQICDKSAAATRQYWATHYQHFSNSLCWRLLGSAEGLRSSTQFGLETWKQFMFMRMIGNSYTLCILFSLNKQTT